ncbi:MAG: winged helix-turn-helix domain-containing protein [Nevskia sp.]|nr:winged helix-turn-helix domain-containing protein [Nevskia sp.]
MGDERTAIWRFAQAELDARTHEVRVRGLSVGIEPKPLEVLRLLLEHAGEVVTTDEILETVWGGRPVHEAAVSNAIGKLRRALGDDDQSLILTVPKVGYRLMAEVERSTDAESSVQLGLQAGDCVPDRPHWRLVKPLGGGSGNAWLAEHVKTRELRFFKFCNESQQLRALKREVTLYRLLHEALGEGAAVARILDWQFEKEPYFVESEYVGADLRSWLDGQGGPAGMDLGLRIELVAQIAEAVGAAHSVGVLHKDVKPQNILVEEIDGLPRIRLCDFGAGQAEAGRLNSLGITMLGFTQTVAHADNSGAGTLVYMAPELFSGGSASVQSDVFALGVLLYQLVTGQWRPIASGWEADVPDELLRDDIRQATNGTPQRRLPSAQLLAERLRSLPQRRAEQARQLAEQERLQQARRELDRTRAKRPWVMLTGIVLILGLTASTALLLQERQAVQAAELQRNIATQFNEFLNRDIIKAASPDYGGRYDITLKQAVVSSLPEIPKRLGGSPLVEAALDLVLADTLDTLSEQKEAIKLAERSAQLYSDNLGPDDLQTLTAKIGVVEHSLEIVGPDGLHRIFDDTYAKLRRTASPDDLVMLKARTIEGMLAYKAGNMDTASQIWGNALKEYPSPSSKELSEWIDKTRIDYLGARLFDLDECTKNVELARQWLPHFVSTYGEKGRPTLNLREALGDALACHGVGRPELAHFAEAETELRAAISGYSELYGPDSLETLIGEEDLAYIYFFFERNSECIALSQRVYEGIGTQLGTSSLAAYRPQFIRLSCLNQSGQINDAIPLAQKLLDQTGRDLGKTDYRYRYTLLISAQALLYGGHTAEANVLIDELMVNLVQAPDTQFTRTQRSLLSYLQGIRAQQQGDIQAAIAYLTDATRRFENTLGPNCFTARDARSRLQALRKAEAQS